MRRYLNLGKKKSVPKKPELQWCLKNTNELSSTKPDDESIVETWSCTFNPFRGKHIIRLVDYRPIEGVKLFSDFEADNDARIRLMISNLQKCVRRREIDRGIRTAYHLIRVDPKRTFRRWLVICVEDGVPCWRFSVLTWICCALHYNNYQLRQSDVQLFMDSVSDVLKDTRCDDFRFDDADLVLDKWEEYPSVVQAMIVRASLGGMKHDMLMMLCSGEDWLKRGTFNDQCTQGEGGVALNKIGDVQIDDVLEVAADFHVSRKNLEKYRIKGMPEDEVRRAIWYHASGVIFRDSIAPGSDRKERFAKGVEETHACWNAIQR